MRRKWLQLLAMAALAAALPSHAPAAFCSWDIASPPEAGGTEANEGNQVAEESAAPNEPTQRNDDTAEQGGWGLGNAPECEESARKTAFGIFSGQEPEYTGKSSPQARQPRRENGDRDYDTASDVRNGGNVRTYVVQNPWIKFDPLGLEWEIERNKDNEIAKATATEDTDTWEDLANLAGLDADSVSDWVTGYEDNVGVGTEDGVPNTILAVTLLTKRTEMPFLAYGQQIDNVREIGFHVKSNSHKDGYSSGQFLGDLDSLSSGKALQGILVDGHGFPSEIYNSSKKGNSFEVSYSQMSGALYYKLGVGILNVCNGGWCGSDRATELQGGWMLDMSFQAYGWNYASAADIQSKGLKTYKGQVSPPASLLGGLDLMSGNVEGRAFYGLKIALDPTMMRNLWPGAYANSHGGNANIPGLFGDNKQGTQ